MNVVADGQKKMKKGSDIRAFEVTNYICNICDKSYLRLDLCRQHLSKHVSNLRCDLCGKSFAKYEHLLNHTRAHTKGENHSLCECLKLEIKISELPLQCTQCTKSFYKNEPVIFERILEVKDFVNYLFIKHLTYKNL